LGAALLGALGEAEQARVADEVDPPAVGDRRVERAAPGLPHGLAGAGADGRGRAAAEVRVEDEVPEDDRAAGDLPARVARPADLAGPGVERVELAVVGAD